MPILAYGVNHRSATIDVRERLAIPVDHQVRALQSLRSNVPSIREALILSTCNRTELHCYKTDRSLDDIAQWFSCDRDISVEELHAVAYDHWDQDAVRHAMRVACGLDSQVLGEPQILGQYKIACTSARTGGGIQKELNLLCDSVLRVAKRVRSTTDIGRNAVSIPYATVTMAKQIFSDLTSTDVLIVGAGDTSRRVAEHLVSDGVLGTRITVANRTVETAEEFARSIGAKVIPLSQIAATLHEYDIVVSSTGSSSHIVYREELVDAMKRRRRRSRPMFIVDLAVPRDIDPKANDVNDLYLYAIDDLTELVEENIQSRQTAAENAESLVNEGAEEYERDRRLWRVQSMLKQYRGIADQTRNEALTAAVARLNSGEDAEEVLDRLAHDLTNKLLHGPMSSIRTAGEDESSDRLDAIRFLFGLD